METILSSVIAAAVTLFFVRRHVKAMPASKTGTRPARRRDGDTESEKAA
jgi:hypothetical protein